MSTFPTSLDNLSESHADGTAEVIHASTINDLASAVNAIEVATQPIVNSFVETVSPPWNLNTLWTTGPDDSIYTVDGNGVLTVAVDYATDAHLTLPGTYDLTDRSAILDLTTMTDNVRVSWLLGGYHIDLFAGVDGGTCGGPSIALTTFTDDRTAYRFLRAVLSSRTGRFVFAGAVGNEDWRAWTVIKAMNAAPGDVANLAISIQTFSFATAQSFVLGSYSGPVAN